MVFVFENVKKKLALYSILSIMFINNLCVCVHTHTVSLHVCMYIDGWGIFRVYFVLCVLRHANSLEIKCI